MQNVGEMTLPLLAVEQPAYTPDPMPFVEAARRQHPWLARSNVGAYIIHGYQATKDILYMDGNLRPSADGIVEAFGADPDHPWSHFMTEMMLFAYGPNHTRLRNSVADAFTPRNVNRYREMMRGVISGLLDEWAPKGKFDFVEFASHFPIAVFCGLMGISTVTAPGIREAFEVQAASTTLDRSLLPALLAGYELTSQFADKLVADREQSGVQSDGILDELIKAKQTGKINATELRHMLLLLINAGYDTSKNMLSLLMHTMIQHPDMWTRCAEDRAYCGKVVEEIFRHSGVSSVYRTVTEDFTYDGVSFPKGTVLIFLVGIAGRDPAVYPDPMAFNPDRTHAQRHMAFGRGVHICIGQHLAKLQIEEGVHVIAQRLTKPRLAGDVKWRPYLGIWGIKSLPIEFTPGGSRAQAAE